MTTQIDIDFNFYSDTPPNKDPDSYSPTLRSYHKLLWSKSLPGGAQFKLVDTTPYVYLHHNSELGEFFFSSDAITHSYKHVIKMSQVISQVPPEEIDSLFRHGSTIGAYTIFPGNKINNKPTINGMRGLSAKIKDRFDLTLEAIRLYYDKQSSPLGETFERYSDFFDLFVDFKGYVEFFLLQDLVTEDFSAVKFHLPFTSFDNSPLPNDAEEYLEYKNNTTRFIKARNLRILESVAG
jgi:hypothetical protein